MTFGFSVFEKPIHEFTLEEMLTSPRAFGLATASPVQRAICRVVDGLPLGDLAVHPDVLAVFGGEAAVAALPRLFRKRPKTVLLLAGVRCAKSMIAGAAAVRAALTCDVAPAMRGPAPRVSVLSVRVDNAKATFDHIRDNIEKSPELAALIIGKPKELSLKIRHPSGVAIEIMVVAGGRAANSLQSRWSAGFIADEAPRMLGQEDGVSNLDDATHAIAFRLLPGAQSFLIGSPWAPFGPVYEMVQSHHGRPSEDLVVVRAKGWQMNPVTFTPEHCAALKRDKPDEYEVDVECNFKAPGATLLDLQEIEACATLTEPPAPDPLLSYVAVMDPATRGNAWALLVMADSGEGKVTVALSRQWLGSSSRPLSPRVVLQEIAELLKPYNTTTVHSDDWSADALKDIAHQVGLYLFTHPTGGTLPERFERVRARISDRTLVMVRDAALLRDLSSVRKRVTSNGVAIDLPLTADGRHCDFAAALALGLSLNLPPPDKPEPVLDYATERKREVSRVVQSMQARKRTWEMPP